MELPVETGEVGRVLDFRVASWDKERFGECQTVELPFGTGGGGEFHTIGLPVGTGEGWESARLWRTRERLGEC